MLGRTDRRLRIVLLLVFFAVFGAAAVLRMGYWQVARGAELQQDAMSQLEKPISEPSVRGDILDRNGVVLATTAYRDTLVAYPDQIPVDQRVDETNAIATILDFNSGQRRDLLAKLGQPNMYQVLARDITDDQSNAVHAAIDAGKVVGLGLETHPVRLYPDTGGQPGTTLGSQLLGFVTADGAGSYGIEQQYNSILAGKPELIAALRDSDGNVLQSSEQIVDPGTPGQSIKLTIDASLQLQLEKELYAAWVADGAQSASAVVMDPNTGEVLAWASVPGYDANDYAAQAQSDPSVFQDPVISQVYEPGSVMKMFTAAAAMAGGTVRPGTIVHDRRQMTFGPQTIHNSDWKSMGAMTLRDAVAYSRNLAMANVALHLDRTQAGSARKLYSMWKTFGIGAPTGVDVSGEVAGIAQDPQTTPWQPIDIADRAFGQSVAVTQLQLANGYATMVNGGYRVQPHLLVSIGSGPPAQTPEPQRAISPGLADELKGVLEHVTASVPWYAQGSLIPGYQIGGKTGTAQIWDSTNNKYTKNRFNFSFVGFAGGDAPRVVVAVRIADAVPTVKGQGDLQVIISSYQLFHRIASDALARLDVPKSSDPERRTPGAWFGGTAAAGPQGIRQVAAIGTPQRRWPAPSPAPRRGRSAAVGRRPAVRGESTTDRRKPTADRWRRLTHPVREFAAIVTNLPSASPAAERPGFDGAGLASAVRGTLLRSGRLSIRGGAVNSRRVQRGNAFFALPGERTDGHQFLGEAAAAGAAALVVREAPSDAQMDAFGPGVSVIAVDDCGSALRRAAASWRTRFDPLVVGITGSIAKTSTKEQIAEVMASRWRVLRNEGNENNEVGLPLTLLRLGPQHEVAVLEMGMYVAGDIAVLAALARPSIGVVTAVRATHLERAGSLDAIERGKRELVEALPRDGTAVLNADDPRVNRMREYTEAHVLRYGFATAVDVAAEDIASLGEHGMRFTLRLPDRVRAEVVTPALGRHSVHNALAAAAVGFAAGLATDEIVRGLAAGFRAPHRTNLVQAGSWRILDDSYNASPDSMAAALELLATLPGRHVAVLGEMLELGEGTDESHREVGRRAAQQADRLVVVGAGARLIGEAALDTGMPADAVQWVPDRDAAVALLERTLEPGDTILVKASRGPQLDLLVDELVALGEREFAKRGRSNRRGERQARTRPIARSRPKVCGAKALCASRRRGLRRTAISRAAAPKAPAKGNPS